MYITESEAAAISDGVKKFLLIPDEPIYLKEIRQISEGRFAAVVGYDIGTLDHWLHDKAVLQDHACAHPHEMTDYLRRKFGQVKGDQQVWARIELVRVPEWDEMPAKEVKQGLFKLLFRMKTENRI